MPTDKVFSFKWTDKKMVDGKEVKERKEANVTCVQFADYSDAVQYYEEKEGAGKGESFVLNLINDSIKNTAVANERATLTRGTSTLGILRNAAEKAKGDPTTAAELNAVLLKMGLPPLNL